MDDLCEPDQAMPGLHLYLSGCIFRQDDVPSVVLAATGTCLVGHFRFMTVGALRKRPPFQVVMGAPPVAPRS